jgi:DNA-directed RNA polymerase beta' subunit
MNMHMPQNAMAETELRNLAAIPFQLISPANNAPIIGIYQDNLLGSYRFTRSEMVLTPRHAMNLLMMYPQVNPETLFANGQRVTNFDVLSQIMPPLTLKYKTKLWDADKKEDPAVSNDILEIKNGKYIRGQLEKSAVGSSTKGIVHRVCNDFGNRAASDFIDHLQNVVTEYMKTSSYSVGVSDLMSNRETSSQIIQVIKDKKLDVAALIQKVHTGIFENNAAHSNKTEFETQVNNILNEATNETDKISRKSLNPNNRFLMIVNSGSKGTLINISHMISCLGQVNVDGKRVPYGFDNRSLPHFCKYDDSPNARGFIENSYIGGLTAPELFFHAMGGRIGLIDTAVKTSTTGYIQRRLIKGLEDLKVEYDMTVRNSKGKIVQFAYGDDGFDTMKVENQNIPLVGMTTQDIYMHYDLSDSKATTQVYMKGVVTRYKKQEPQLKEMCKKYIEKMMTARDEIAEKIFHFKDENAVFVPVAFQHIINNVQGQLGLAANSVVDFTPYEAFQLIEEYFEKIRALYYAPPTALFETLYFFYLTPKDLLITKRFHRKGLIVLLETIVLKYKQAIVHPGEMVGVVAGQSIGEPTTQLTLNSVTYETELLVRNKEGVIKTVQIGDFTKWGIDTSSKIEYMADKDTTYAELSEYYEVPSATEDGQTVWRRIEAVTKHPVINKDGTNTMLKVTTDGLREVIVTKAKSLLQLVDGKIQGVNGEDLRVGDYLPVSRKPLEFKENVSLGYDFGYLAGSYCNGYPYSMTPMIAHNMSTEQMEKLIGNESHRFISDTILFSNYECMCGFLDAFIGGGETQFTDNSVSVNSKHYKLLLDTSIMLRNLDIVSRVVRCGEMFSIVIENKDCTKLAYLVRKNSMHQFKNRTFESRKDLLLPNKVDSVIEMQPRNGAMMDLAFEKVVSIEEIPNTTPYAYDLTVEDTRNFDCMNGVCVRDTFHNAGVASKSNVTRGVPRIEEILRLTKHPKNPSLTVHLKPLDEESQERAKKFANMLEHTRLSDVVQSMQICFDPDENNTKIEEDRVLIEQFYEFSRLVEECNGQQEDTIAGKSKWIIRMEMDTETLLDKNITMDDIHFAIKQGPFGQDVDCIYSDYNADKLVFRIRFNGLASKKKKSAEPLDQSDEIYLLKRFQNDLLSSTVLRGINHIDNVIPRKLQNMVTKNDGKYEKKDMWILDTTGTNLLETLGIEYIDSTRTYSNDIKEIFDVLGLEAARQVIHNELVEVMEFSGVYINYHHVSLLCDRMTTNKDMVSIFRTGLFNDDIGPIAKATFEVHTEVLLDAARYGEFDHMRGVSANVMCGQNGFYGTNAFQLVLDMNEMSKLEDQMVETESAKQQIDQAFAQQGKKESDQCPRSKIEVKNNITSLKRIDPGLCNDGYDAGF